MNQRPNFLFIITDQHRADHLGCYGDPVVRTPNIDAIAAGGARWNRFYVANPICMPNRASIMTGRMSSLHGARHNGIPLSKDWGYSRTPSPFHLVLCDKESCPCSKYVMCLECEKNQRGASQSRSYY